MFEQSFCNMMLDFFFNDSAVPPPSVLYLGISYTMLRNGQNITEPQDPAYARQAMTPQTWGAASNGSKSNEEAVVFPAATQDWGKAAFWFLSDSPTGGNVVCSGRISIPVKPRIGEYLVFDPGDLTITMN